MRILAVDIGGTSVKLIISDEKGKIELFTEYDTESEKGGKYLVEKLINIFSGYKGFDAIGVSTAGQVNSDEGTIIYANDNIPGYTGTKLKEILESRFKVPVKVENDVNAAALGEAWFGAAKDFKDFLCTTFGTGIGGAIVTNSKIYKGHRGLAAEFGHIITHPMGNLCTCGHLGCYETYASTRALVKKAMEIDQSLVDGRAIFDRLAQKDLKVDELIRDWVFEIALGLTTLIHIFNPPAIVLGGGIMEQEQLVQMISEKVKELVMESFSDCIIMKASLGNKAGVLGAVSLHARGDY